ncbi:phasin family protein [Candidatus Dependentiae bacterium]|nr:phasin family protein [Candidatus Dependentiae bacterium]
MLELLKKTVLSGIGMTMINKEKIKGICDEIVKTAKLSEEDGKKLFDELLSKSNEAKQTLEHKIETVTSELLKKLKVPTNDEILKLNNKIEELEKKISYLEQQK